MTGLKFSQRKDGTLEVRGLGIPFGGPINGKDLHGQFFSAKTDFAWDLIPDGARPLLYQHGLDDTVKTEVVGRWGVEKVDAKGVWVRAQLSARSSYLSEIKELLTEDALGLSSATMGHLVKVNQKNGEILNWPVVELSLTPNPANPTAYVVKSMVTPARHAAKLLRVLKHGDHDQSSHGDRDGAGDGGSDKEDLRPTVQTVFRDRTPPSARATRTVSQARAYLEKADLAGISTRDQDKHSDILSDIESSLESNFYGQVAVSAAEGALLAEKAGNDTLQDFYDDLIYISQEKKSWGRKHGDHDQSEHGNRDGASGGGGSDSGDKPSQSSSPLSTGRSHATHTAGSVRRMEGHIDSQEKSLLIAEQSLDKVPPGEARDFIKEKVDQAKEALAAARTIHSGGGNLHDVAERISRAEDKISSAFILAGRELGPEVRDRLDALRTEGFWSSRMAIDLANDGDKTKSYGRKHGDHDQADHGNRDGAGGGESEEPRGNGMGGTSRGAERAMGLANRAKSINDRLKEKLTSSVTLATPAHREVAGHLTRVTQALGTAARTTELSSRSDARGDIRTANHALWDASFAIANLPDSERGAFAETLRSIQILQSDMREFTLNDEMFKSLKHGDHDQADHGNRDGASGGGSDSGDKPSSEPVNRSGRSNEARAASPRNGNNLLPWRGRTFDPSGYPRAAMSEAREYAKESLAKIQEYIKPIDPDDDDDIRRTSEEQAGLSKYITDSMTQLKEGNVGGALSNLARASSRASRNDEARELTDALDFLYDRTAASFGLDDVMNPDNLGEFSSIRESARAHFRDLAKNPGRGRRSFKADFLNEDAEEGTPEEEANEESDTLQASIAKLVESTEYTLGEIAEALAKATDENNEVIVNCLTESQDALEKLAGELATYLEGTSPMGEVEDETETETPMASTMASLAVLAGKPSRAEENLAAVKAALSAEIRKQTLVAIGRKRDR